jgi:hypothetical protein
MTPRRIGALLGGVAPPVYILTTPKVPWLEPGLWFFLLFLAGIGAIYGAALAHSLWLAFTRVPPIRPVVTVLVALSLVTFTLHGHRHLRAQRFLARADSTLGEVSQFPRGGGIRVTYRVDDHGFSTAMRRPDSLAHAQLRDSLWVYYSPTFPDSAHIGHPQADWGITRTALGWIWLGLGPLLYSAGPFLWAHRGALVPKPPVSTA